MNTRNIIAIIAFAFVLAACGGGGCDTDCPVGPEPAQSTNPVNCSQPGHCN